MIEKRRFINIQKKNESARHLDDNFWFDEITERSLGEQDILIKTKPTIKLVQNPNYYFMKNQNNNLQIKKNDMGNIPQYPSIEIIPNDNSFTSKLPKHIIELRRKSQVLNRQQLESLIDKINDEDILKNYNISENFHHDRSEPVMEKKPRFAYTDSQANDDLRTLVKDIKKEILHEILEEVRKPTTNAKADSQLITQEFINRRIKKVHDKLQAKKPKKSLLELTKESKYSFEKNKLPREKFTMFEEPQPLKNDEATVELTNIFDFGNNNFQDKEPEKVNLRDLLGDE